MMATDSLELEDIDDKKPGSPIKKRKRNKRAVQETNSNGIVENGNGSVSDSLPTRSTKRSESKKHNDSKLEPSIPSQLSEENTNENTNKLDKTLTPVESSQTNGKHLTEVPKIPKYELTTVTDEEDDDNNNNGQDQRKTIRPTDYITTDPNIASPMTQSFTSGDHDAVEIHEFSLVDVDAYLEIYFTTLNNRLRHFIGESEQIEQFRKAMKQRITSDRNAREYQNVLLGKISGEVVAAVTLAFPGETATISNDNLLPQVNSCFASIRRWMLKNANYNPTNIEECYIEMIGVKKAFQNHGIGAAMLECVEHFARQAGALILTVHTNDERVRNYFQRFGFALDHTDNSAIWKWAVERQNTHKMFKTISPDEENHDYAMDNTSSYVTGSVVESEPE